MKSKKQYYYLLLLIPVVYLVLIGILYIAEVGQPDSQIHNFGDVIWYSLVTLTTVGYGDMTPVTTIGRTVSIIFLLMSMGLMVTVIGALFSFLTGAAFPLFLLGRQRRKNWYYFADYGPESITMARNILKEDTYSVIIFGERPGKHDQTIEFPCYYLQLPLSTIIHRKENEGKPCMAFFMRENDINQNSRALDIRELPITVYARTTNSPDHASGNTNFFDSYECCARQYWQTQPLQQEESKIVIIGFGHYGQNLLERAIVTNILLPDQQVTYHIFGDSDTFLKMHCRLDQVFTVIHGEGNVPESSTAISGDCLFFHKDSWESAHDVLASADRILICSDEEDEGWGIYWNLQRYYAIRGRIDIRSSREVSGVSCFGSNTDIYNPQQILRRKLNVSAEAMNDIYRKYSPGNRTLSWDELSDFMRQSKIATADHILVKIRILLPNVTVSSFDRELLHRASEQYRRNIWDESRQESYRKIEHDRWCRFYAFHNWQYGPTNDWESRRHPLLRPYEELTETEKMHHDHAWQLLNELELYL